MNSPRLLVGPRMRSEIIQLPEGYSVSLSLNPLTRVTEADWLPHKPANPSRLLRIAYNAQAYAFTFVAMSRFGMQRGTVTVELLVQPGCRRNRQTP